MKREQVARMVERLVTLAVESPDTLAQALEQLEKSPAGVWAWERNTKAEQQAFLAEWNAPQPQHERAALTVGRGEGSADVLEALNVAEAALGLAAATKPATRAEAMLDEATKTLGVFLLEIVAARDGGKLRRLARMIDGGPEPAASEWKACILRAFLTLAKASNFSRLPTKQAVRDAVEGRPSFDERTFRRQLRELGLRGLPEAKPGPKGKPGPRAPKG